MNVMILAAGEGTRLRPYTTQVPKAAIPFFSVPMGCYSLSLLDRLKINRLVINTHHLPEQIIQLYSGLHPHWDELVFSSEAQGLLNSGGGIHKAQAYLTGHDDFFVLNGDEVILPQEMDVLSEMLQFHRWHKGLATLLTMKHPEVGQKFGGVWVHSNEGTANLVQCFSKKDPGLPQVSGLHFLGVLLLKDSIFKYFKEPVPTPAGEYFQPENILYETLTSAIAAGEKVYAYETKAHWFETGNAVDFIKATEWCLQELTVPESAYWKEYLKQSIRLFGTDSYVLEKTEASFVKKFPALEQLVKQIRQGRL